MLKNLPKRLGILRSRYGRRAVYNKKRNSLEAQFETFVDLFGDFFHADNTIQERTGFGFRKAGFRSDLDQDVMSTDIATLCEIGFEERLRQSILLIALFSPPQEPMAGDGIRCD